MFDFIRKHTKITMWLLFLLIVPSFVLLGMNDHTRSTGTAAVAQVDGRDITQAEWDAAHRTEIVRLRAPCQRWTLSCWTRPKRATPRWSGWSASA